VCVFQTVFICHTPQGQMSQFTPKCRNSLCCALLHRLHFLFSKTDSPASQLEYSLCRVLMSLLRKLAFQPVAKDSPPLTHSPPGLSVYRHSFLSSLRQGHERDAAPTESAHIKRSRSSPPVVWVKDSFSLFLFSIQDEGFHFLQVTQKN